MNNLLLSWKNLRHRPWSTVLSLVLGALAAGLIALILLVSQQLEEQFNRNLAEVDLVLGAKGSPLQLILSSMYHLDAPTGNISLAESAPFLNPQHPYIESAIPLSMGDTYQSYRIVGTQPDFLSWYGATLAEGRIWQAPLEVVVGAAAARKLGLEIGNTFQSSHGYIEDADLVHEEAGAFSVVGLLAPSGTVADQLLLTANESLWAVHEGHQAEHADDGATPDSAAATAIAPDLSRPLADYTDRSITALLLKFKGTSIQSLNMQRAINENTNLQAASPPIEINRLYDNLSTGEEALRLLAYIIVGVSMLSIFISLYSNLRDRRYEMALMRTLGASRVQLFGLVLLEGLLLAVVGAALGLLLAHTGLWLIGQLLEVGYRYSLSAGQFITEEIWIIGAAAVLGLIAAFLPALEASRTDIHNTLAEG